MQLLLFLSALLASLTGAFAGERGVAAMQRPGDTAISRAADATIDVAVQVAIALPRPATPRAAAPSAPGFVRHAAPALRPARLTSERRLE